MGGVEAGGDSVLPTERPLVTAVSLPSFQPSADKALTMAAIFLRIGVPVAHVWSVMTVPSSSFTVFGNRATIASMRGTGLGGIRGLPPGTTGAG